MKLILEHYIHDPLIVAEMLLNVEINNDMTYTTTRGIVERFEEQFKPIFNMEIGRETTIEGYSWTFVQHKRHWILWQIKEMYVYEGPSDGWVEYVLSVEKVVSNQEFNREKWQWCYDKMNSDVWKIYTDAMPTAHVTEFSAIKRQNKSI